MSVEPYRLLVVAIRTGPCPGLPGVVLRHLDHRPAEVHVIAPVQVRRLRWAVSDVDEGLKAAHVRLGIAIALLERTGLRATGEVGDSNPVCAIEDALSVFDAHAVLISTWPAGHSNWLERDVVARARRRLSIAVHHVVSDFDAAPVGEPEVWLPAAA